MQQQLLLPRAAKPASFWVALVFGVLLLGSGLLNLLLFFFLLFSSAASEALGGASMLDMQTRETYLSGPRDSSQKVVVIDIEGVIAPSQAGLLGVQGESMVARVERYLGRAAADSNVVGVVLRVDSPGGAVTDSDQIYQLLREFREETGKSVATYFHATAASGGYYVGMAGERVFMHPTGITGSIGVIMGIWNYSKAAKQLGIERVTIVSERTPYKDLLDGAKPVAKGEKRILLGLVDEMYDRFVDVVAAGRPELSRDQIEKLADGRIYSARQAQRAGLVDEMGSLRDAVAWVRARCDAEQAKAVRYEPLPSFLDSLMGAQSAEGRIASRLGLLDPSPKLLYLWAGGL